MSVRFTVTVTGTDVCESCTDPGVQPQPHTERLTVTRSITFGAGGFFPREPYRIG